MGPQFILAGIPTIQIGHETYEDVLVRNGLAPTVTDAIQLTREIKNLEEEIKEKPQKDFILSKLGIREDWPVVLEEAIRAFISSKVMR
ncbi:hypothetical protein [Parachlamydia sp. AcF125]|uniref:hypothetical protein n=1 Tax=Parachlamydia sp. AcF125 TaxID=2795736 RepID=UPI001BCA34D0|nr:hypothetical protein [Parachlamydia sp. AcF125]MBS4168333.1 hypothetical protein [Parachlamydia sp. AcF125]